MLFEMLFEPALAQVERRGLHHSIDTIHLDRGCIGARVDNSATEAGTEDLVRPSNRKPDPNGRAKTAPAPLGLRRRVERAGSWLSNHGQLRRNTDRRPDMASSRPPHPNRADGSGLTANSPGYRRRSCSSRTPTASFWQSRKR
ncbi:hypothetical protein [Candidatus Poriferisodalis sp.]|uniref:hypothetical protein n=1 Tax=Candidatus Poriferisodalis sp. TaxID=3101277 RepID=UPI003B024FFE